VPTRIKRLFAVHAKRQLRELYIFIFFQSFASSLTSIFEPVLLFQLGYGLPGIALYYAVHYTIYVVAMPLGAMFANRFGYERSIAISTPLLAVHFLVLSQLPHWPALFWVAPGVLALHKMFFWPAFHANFAAHTAKANSGTELSWAQLVAYSSGVVGPILGGFIAAAYGFSTLFLIAAFTLLVAVISMLRTPERQGATALRYSTVWKFLVRKPQRRMVIAMIGWGENLIHTVFWPVFLFIVVGSLSTLGLIVSIGAALSVVWGFIVGELSDKHAPRKIIRFAAPLTALTYVVRIFTATTPLGAAVGDVYTRVAQSTLGIPFTSRLYRSAKQQNIILYALSFELVLAIVKAVVSWGLFFLLLSVTLETGFLALFVLGAIFALFYAAL